MQNFASPLLSPQRYVTPRNRQNRNTNVSFAAHKMGPLSGDTANWVLPQFWCRFGLIGIKHARPKRAGPYIVRFSIFSGMT